MTRTCVRLATVALCCWITACSGDDDGSPPHTDGKPPRDSRGDSAAPTYYGEIAPLFAQHCMRCHRDGGIAPFRLDDYAQAKSFAKLIKHVTSERTMPPWSVTSDGSCGEFADSEALTDEEIEKIAQWVDSGATEGKARSIEVPPVTALSDATDFKTPEFAPVAQGGELAASDEYRCFVLDAPDAPSFITGYDVVPGAPEIVHHVAAFLIDPEGETELDDGPQTTNAEQMRKLDDESPDRDGWPCFGQAGDGLSVVASPVIWAPGQGVVEYPNESGVYLDPKFKIVVQVHYNLADPRNEGMHDQTTVRFRTVPKVKNVGMFVLQDELLDTLFDGEPETLPAGRASTLYKWSASAREMGIGSLPQAEFWGVMPHMHQLGHKYELTVTQPGEPAQCGAKIDQWDFHWQRMYFYAEPTIVKPDTKISVTCDFDTRSVQVPVKPGWGTRNEMCLATMYFTVPLSQVQGMGMMSR
jgi:Copper type II ascorbate-dependent monooxygenase, C-terminal domain